LMVLPFQNREVLKLFKDWRVWVRGSLLACGITSIQTALQTAEIADVFAAFFIGPMISYILAVIFLREPVTWIRSFLIMLGFAGVLLVVRPSGDMEPGLLFAALAGLFYGGFLTTSRWLAGVGTPPALTLTQLAISSVLLLPWGLSHVPVLTPQILWLTAMSAFCSMMGNLLLLYAYRIAPATRLAPMVYFQLIAAVALGWFIFDALPDAYTWAGLALVIGTGLISTRLR
jgi:drug/metabolite transporter (DMT)-like permease